MVGLKKYMSIKGQPTNDSHIDKFLANSEIYKNVKAVRFGYSQLTTGTAVEIEQKTGTAIARIGKTELTLVGAFSADDNYYDGSYVFITYKSNDGITHSAYMATNTTSTTEVAFTEYDVDGNDIAAVTDFYLTLTIDIYDDITKGTPLPTQAAETFGMGSTGALTFGVVAAEASSAVAAGRLGVGAVYGRYHTNHNDYDGAVQYMEYVTPWGEVKWAKCTTDTTDSTTEVSFFEGTSVTGYGVVTAGTVVVADFYRRRTIYTSFDPNAGHTWLLCDSNCANVDGSGGDVYGMIEEGYFYSIHSEYHCPLQHYAILHFLEMMGPGSATNSAIVTITFTVRGSLQATTLNFTIAAASQVPHLEIVLEPGTDCTFTIIDTANAFTADVYIKIVEAEDKNSSYGSVGNYGV